MHLGAWRITQERVRQIEEEGFDSLHDSDHEHGELLEAAHCYMITAQSQIRGGPSDFITFDGESYLPDAERVPSGWPWQAKWWKPSESPIRNLEKAGALIAAEIDRLSMAIESEVEELAGG